MSGRLDRDGGEPSPPEAMIGGLQRYWFQLLRWCLLHAPLGNQRRLTLPSSRVAKPVIAYSCYRAQCGSPPVARLPRPDLLRLFPPPAARLGANPGGKPALCLGLFAPRQDGACSYEFALAFACFGRSAQCPLNRCPLCSAAIAVNTITPMTKNSRKKTTAITRTGIPHLCAHFVTLMCGLL